MDAAQFAAHECVESSHWWFTGRREILGAIVEALAGGAATALADIGCGTGGNAAAFAEQGHRVLGVDPAPDAIAAARRRFPHVRFERDDDLTEVAGHLATGGIALLGDVLEHVEHDAALLRRVIQVVPSGGHVVLTVPADPDLWSPHDIAFGHFRRYTLPTFAVLWHDLPVEQRLLTPFNARLYPVIRAVRMLQRNRPPAPAGDLALPVGMLNTVLHRTLAGERRRLVAALDSGTAPYTHGVSLLAVLRRS